MIEPLEPRVAPAVLINASRFSYTDIDGDKVVVKFTKPILTTANFDTLISITGGLDGTGPQDMTVMSLANLGVENNGLGITVTATPVKNTLGDGRVRSLSINASEVNAGTGMGFGIDLGVVKIDGDVNFIHAGDPVTTTLALKSFTAASMGADVAALGSEVFGSVGTFKVLGDFAGELVLATNGSLSAKIGTLKIGGSIVGVSPSATVRIRTDGGIDNVFVGGDIIGGAVPESGSIISPNGYKTVVVKGSIIGGSGNETGFISGIAIGRVTIGGSLVGGSGDESGVVRAYGGLLGKATIGAIIGGTGNLSGVVQAGSGFNNAAELGTVLIKRGVFGAEAFGGGHGLSGAILANNNIGKITVLGGFIGGSIAAGVNPGPDGQFGTVDDTEVLGSPEGSLGAVAIKGVIATPQAGDAIRALSFTSIKAGGGVIKPGSAFADFTIGFTIGDGLLVRAL